MGFCLIFFFSDPVSRVFLALFFVLFAQLIHYPKVHDLTKITSEIQLFSHQAENKPHSWAAEHHIIFIRSQRQF